MLAAAAHSNSHSDAYAASRRRRIVGALLNFVYEAVVLVNAATTPPARRHGVDGSSSTGNYKANFS